MMYSHRIMFKLNHMSISCQVFETYVQMCENSSGLKQKGSQFLGSIPKQR